MDASSRYSLGPFYCDTCLGFRPRVFFMDSATGSGSVCSIVTKESSVAGFVAGVSSV